MKLKYDWLDERNSIENNINEIQDICLIRNISYKEAKQEILNLTDKILIALDNIDFAIDDISNDYEDKIDDLNDEIENLETEINELKGGK